jgi:hypothetical protein
MEFIGSRTSDRRVPRIRERRAGRPRGKCHNIHGRPSVFGTTAFRRRIAGAAHRTTSEVAMQCRWLTCAALFAASGLAAETFAERPPEERSKATHVILGTVKAVYVRDGDDVRQYLVVIAIEKVEKGEGFKPGETFYVGCYRSSIPDFYRGMALTAEERKRLYRREGYGYEKVPKEGERVRVYAKHHVVYANGRPGKYDGIYPDWYDVVTDK